MATVLRRLSSLLTQLKKLVKRLRPFPAQPRQSSRGKGVLQLRRPSVPKPETNNLGVVKAILAVLPGLYVGATISKQGAAFLEENDNLRAGRRRRRRIGEAPLGCSYPH
uniref:Essential MCU regulator, mitochondrial n=1 Tax=Ixodes ricinus TaxID=34613 RepID=V5HD32_IXORI